MGSVLRGGGGLCDLRVRAVHVRGERSRPDQARAQSRVLRWEPTAYVEGTPRRPE